jgi:hypothetical protein
VVQVRLGQITFPADAVHRLQRALLGHGAEEAHESLAFGQLAESPERLDDKRRVP